MRSNRTQTVPPETPAIFLDEGACKSDLDEGEVVIIREKPMPGPVGETRIARGLILVRSL